MSYFTQAQLAADVDIQLRVAACAAGLEVGNPQGWASEHSWALSAQPGWDAAYASALASETGCPGRDEGVITDGMILAAVTTIRQAETL